MSNHIVNIIEKVPIPTAGVALGLAALGNLLQPYTEVLHIACGILSLFLVIMVGARIVMFPRSIREDLRNSILASVSATLFMALMQLAVYIAPLSNGVGFALWVVALIAHLCLIGWFTFAFIAHFKLHEVFPTYFITYVGIIVACVTAPAFGMEALGRVFFWFGFTCYLILLVVITYRHIKHPIPEPARPLFCIYAAPMSLSLAGYLSVMETPNALFIVILAVLAQVLFAIVLFRLPHFLRLHFYPSYAAMTFPFVITAIALKSALVFLAGDGYVVPEFFTILVVLESALATGMVFYVFGHYMRFFFRSEFAKKARESQAV
ncbi:MAG: TDT family transporter [Raoultibacter sp.]